jgi:hypothetical protein
MSDPRTFGPDDELVQGLLAHLDERACLPTQLLEELAVGSLPVAEATKVNVHLKDCLACLNTFSRLQSLHDSSAPPARLIVDSPSARRLRVQMSRLAETDGRDADVPRDGHAVLAGAGGDGAATTMICPACGEEERQDRKVAVWRKRAGPLSPTPQPQGRLVLHRECLRGHAWHMPLVIKPGARPTPCDCEARPNAP